MPATLQNCELVAELGHGATHFTALPKTRTYANGERAMLDTAVSAISLVGVPGAIAGPYELGDDVRFEGIALTMTGPEYCKSLGLQLHPLTTSPTAARPLSVHPWRVAPQHPARRRQRRWSRM